MWKCPKCGFKSTSYSAMMKHFYKNHYTAKAGSVPKGKQKKIYTFHPPRRK